MLPTELWLMINDIRRNDMRLRIEALEKIFPIITQTGINYAGRMTYNTTVHRNTNRSIFTLANEDHLYTLFIKYNYDGTYNETVFRKHYQVRMNFGFLGVSSQYVDEYTSLWASRHEGPTLLREGNIAHNIL